MSATTTASGGAVRREESGDAAERHRGVGELPEVGRVGASAATAAGRVCVGAGVGVVSHPTSSSLGSMW